MQDCKASCFTMGAVTGAVTIVILMALGFIPEQVDIFGISFPVSRPTIMSSSVVSPSYEQKIESAKKIGPLWGPVSGELVSKENGYLEKYVADVKVRDFVSEVVFYVPDAPKWDMGILLREDGDSFYAVSLRSDGTWEAWMRSGEDSKQDQNLNTGTLGWLNVQRGARIQVSLWCKGSILHFFVNKQYVATINVSDIQNRGAVSVAIDIYQGYEDDGRTVSFEDFAIWASP